MIKQLSANDIDWYHNPYPDYATLRNTNEPLWLPHKENYGSEGVWLFSSYEDALVILKDTRRITKYVRGRREEAEQSSFDIHMLNRDGKDHVRLRKVVNGFFSPSSMRSLEPFVMAQVNKLLSKIEDQQQGDFISDLALPLPVSIIASIIGIPEQDFDKVRDWSTYISMGSDSQLVDEQLRANRQTAIEALVEYSGWLLDSKSSQPGQDMATHLLVCEKDGLLTRDESLGMISFMLFAGHETTISLLGNMLWLLLSHPDQWALLRKNQDLVPNAVEEVLRYESPTQRSTYRFASEDITISGHQVKEGEQIAAILGAANRDPAVFENPEKFDITRKRNPHLAFGIGPHNCLGKTLARLEAKVALKQILSLDVKPELISETPVWNRNSFFRGLEHLNIKWS